MTLQVRSALHKIIIILLIVIIALATVLFLVSKNNVKNVKITNVTGKSASITWETTTPELTKLTIQSEGYYKIIEKDDRDEDDTQTKRMTHIVTLNDLKPESKYSFIIHPIVIINRQREVEFSTTAVSEHIDNPQPIYGRVTLAEGNDYSDILVHFKVNTERQATESAEYSVAVNKDGNWAIEITSIRDEIGAMFFNLSEVTALIENSSQSTMAAVLGDTSWDENITPEGAISNNYIELITTNGIVHNELYIPINEYLKNTIFSSFLDNKNQQKVLGEDNIVAYDPDERTKQCTAYGFNENVICTNTECPRDRACAANHLNNKNVEKCRAIGIENMILDCCAAGAEIKGDSCVVEPKKEYCDAYGYEDNKDKLCNNQLCGMNRECKTYELENADKTKCLANGTQNIINDCCAEGQIVKNNRCEDKPENTKRPTVKPPTSTVSPSKTISPDNGDGSVACKIFHRNNNQADLQNMMNEVSQYISTNFNVNYINIPVNLIEGSSGGCFLQSDVIQCYRPQSNQRWLNNKLLFHEAMHYYKAAQGIDNPDALSELMASILETYYVNENEISCPGGLYKFYTISNPNIGFTANEILIKSGLPITDLVAFAIYGRTDVFNEKIVRRIDTGGWKFEHLYCNGYAGWNNQILNPNNCSDQPRQVASTINVIAKPIINTNNINDINNGNYRLALTYKTLKYGNTLTNKTTTLKIDPNVNQIDAYKLGEIALSQLYIDKNDDSTNLIINLFSEKVTNESCDSEIIDIENFSDGQEYVIDLTSLSCDYKFDIKQPIGGECKVDDIIQTGIMAPWENVDGAYKSQGYSESHKALDIATQKKGQPLVAAGGGIVKYVRSGDVKDSIFFEKQAANGKCFSINDKYCVCDWCNMGEVRAGENAIKGCANYGCISRAEELRGRGNVINWGVAGGLDVKYGNVVVIEHEKSETVYAHLEEVTVKPGDCVKAGDIIGTLGNTGSSSSEHIHFEIRAKGGANPTNPDGFKCIGSKCSFAQNIANTNYPNILGEESEQHAIFNTDYDISKSTSSFGKGIFSSTSTLLNIDRLVVSNDAFIPEFFIDNNNNSRHDNDETVIDARYLSIDFNKNQAIEDINLNPSWKLISFNAVNSEIKTTEDLARQASLSGIKTELASYLTDKWDIAALKETGSFDEFYGNYFSLQPGDAYFVRSDIDSTYYNTGEIIKNINKELELNSGWNFFAFSQDVLDASNVTSYIVLDKCKQAGLVCSMFAGYNGQLEDAVVVKDIYYGRDYELKANTGYIIKVENSGGKLLF